MANNILNDLSIYLHWPFCKSKCPYCDFFSKVKKNIDQDAIIEGYIKQLENYASRTNDREVVSVFFGGGTPSLITPQNIEKILNSINKLWHVSPNIEVSLEANPNTQTPTLFSDLAHSGINRLSLGVQSLDDTELKFLGRTHTAKQALQAIDDVLKNYTNHSVDLIYALPHQTFDTWQKELNQISSLGLKHLSLYQLTIEENTVFYKKGIKAMDEEKAAQLYQFSDDFLASQGYAKYEVSNYSRPGYQSVHNKAYWIGQDYIGIGQSAHGRLHLDGKIFAVTDPMLFEELSPSERAEELIIMGLRLRSGINKSDFKLCCGLDFDAFINQDFKNRCQKQGLLVDDATTLKATKEGFLLLNYLISGLCGA